MSLISSSTWAYFSASWHCNACGDICQGANDKFARSTAKWHADRFGGRCRSVVVTDATGQDWLLDEDGVWQAFYPSPEREGSVAG